MPSSISPPTRHARELPAGIVVLGTPRSGTTLVRRILDAHPNIACPPETYLLSAAARFMHAESFTHGLKIGVLTGLHYAGFEEADVVERLRAFVFGFFEEHARKQGKPRWAEKTAYDAFHVAAIRKLCASKVKFICVRRHGMDVACSLADLVDKTGGYVDELHAYVRRYPEPLHAFAHAWADTAAAVADVDDGLHIKYEDLAREPEPVVRSILEFVGEPWDDGLLDRALADASQVGFGDWKTYARKDVDTSSVDRWKSLPRAAQARLAEICNPTLERLGYARVQSSHGPVGPDGEDDEDARRRYELGLLINRMKAQKATK